MFETLGLSLFATKARAQTRPARVCFLSEHAAPQPNTVGTYAAR